ncbi:MAG: hypothetical protein IME98_02545 [Proteobacteria bacterium]|nr:hypothetical protein [Pseudomonadota bacterium]
MKPYILIDAGNSMGEDTPQGRLKSEVVINSFAIIGYDATTFFNDDNLLPVSHLSSLVDKLGLPALSKSSSYPSSAVFKQDFTMVNIGADPKAYKKGAFNILLSQGPLSEVRGNKGWDVIILSSGELLEEPVKVDGTLIVSGYPKGEKLGILTLKLARDGEVAGFTHRWQSLGKEITEDQRIRDLIDEYDTKVADLLDDEQRQAPTDVTYFGYESCVECHQPFFEKWKTTRHANAFATLEAVGKSKDPECVKCHTTGYGEQGGYYSATATPGLKNVQCEQCHGSGKDHMSDYTAPMAVIEKSVCLRCHTKENSPDFNFTTYIEKIKH